jgi:ATP-dependent RNA helicase RhlE
LYSVDCYFSNDAKKRQNILFATMTDEVDAILNDYFDYPQEALQPLGPIGNIKQIAYDAF